MVVPLHNHSEYSNVGGFDGFSTTEKMMERCKALGIEAIGLTDHGVVAGHPEFARVAAREGIHPIFGVEAYQARESVSDRHTDATGRTLRDAFHLILLAENDQGLANVWSMSSLANSKDHFFFHPRIDWDTLASFKDGVIATSACMGSLLSEGIRREDTSVLDRYLSIFGEDHFFIEIHTYDSQEQREINLELVNLAKQKGIPLVYATDAHYSCSEDYPQHELLMAIAHHKKIDDPERMSHPPSLFIGGEEDVREALSYLSRDTVDEAIANSVAIAERCQVSIPKPRFHVPSYHALPEQKTNSRLLVDLVMESLETRGLSDDESYINRAKDELKVILSADHLINYFLIQQDIIRYSRDNDVLTGPGRGSVGGSLIAFLLGITDIDPIKYGLIFERFYNAGRAKGGLPDIDIDFPTDKREFVREYISDSYGKDNVAQLGTLLRLRPKSAVDKVKMAMPIPSSDVFMMKAIIDSYTDAGQLASWETVSKDEDMQPFFEKHPEFMYAVGQMCGKIFSSGVHASGVIVSDEPLHSIFPLKYSAKTGVSTQFDMNEAETMGFMKNDMLGITKLDVLVELVDYLSERGIDFPVQETHHSISDDDAGAWKLLDMGLTIGIFQLEAGVQARQITQAIKPRSIEDLAIIFALNRPGPIRSGAVDKFIDRRNGEPYEIYDGMESILGETYGVFVYQEQVIRLMTTLGFSLEEADNVRRIMGKKKPEEMAALYPQYMSKAEPYFGKHVADTVWEDIVDFSKYGFNKSHAVGYAVLAYWTLIAKYRYPLEFLLASIRADSSNVHLFIEEARRMGYDVLGPDINESDYQTSIVGGKIRYGLKDVKGVKGNIDWVLSNRPFTSREDLEDRLSAANEQFLIDKKNGDVPKSARSPRQLFGKGKIDALHNAGAFDTLSPREISIEKRRDLEEEYLGIVISNDAPQILDKHRDSLDQVTVPLRMIDSEVVAGETFLAYGFIASCTRSRTRNGGSMLRVEIENGAESLNFAVFGNVIERYSHVFREFTPLIGEFKKTDRGINLQKARILS